MMGYVYLLHFARPIGNLASPRGTASHYVGWCLDPEERNAQHRAGRGAALTRAAAAAGVTWDLFVLGPGDRELERRIKQLKNGRRLCPICGLQHPGGRLHLPAPAQLALPLDDVDPFDLPAPPARMDWYEWATLRSRAVARYPVAPDAESFGLPY